MKKGSRLYTAISLWGTVGILLWISVYVLIHYKNYQEQSLKILSGQDKSVISGQLIEARIKSIQEMITLSVTNQGMNDEFNSRAKSIYNELTALYKERPDDILNKLKLEMERLITAQDKGSVEDLFVHYRNIKASASNILRNAWENKYVNVVKVLTQIIQDLDNMPYHDADQATQASTARLNQLVTIVTRSALVQQQKLELLSQINQLKSMLSQYNDLRAQSKKIRDLRQEVIKKSLVIIQEYNGVQNKQLVGFTKMSHNKYSMTVFVVILSIFCSILWVLFWRKKILTYTSYFVQKFTDQLRNIFLESGNLNEFNLDPNAEIDPEYDSIYAAMSDVAQKINTIRYEDVSLKKHIPVSLLMISKTRQAIYWNQQVQKLLNYNKSPEDGTVHYQALIKFSFSGGKIQADPIDKCFVEGVALARNYDLDVDQTTVSVRMSCVPVVSASGEVEYVIVHIRDLKDEFKLIDNELSRQLTYIRTATEKLRVGSVPDEAPLEARSIIRDSIVELRRFAYEQNQNKERLLGQIRAAYERLSREGGLKKNVHHRIHQVADELVICASHLTDMTNSMHSLKELVLKLARRDDCAQSEYTAVRKKSMELRRNIRHQQDLIKHCIQSIEQMDHLTNGIRSRERLIMSALEKATIANANNSILRSRPDVSIVEIASLLDGVNLLAEQFERAYRFIQQSVDELEQQYSSFRKAIEESLFISSQLSLDERGLIDSLTSLEKLTEGSAQDFSNLIKHHDDIQGKFSRLRQGLLALEDRSRKLEKIGGASLELQAHLENGVRGILEGTA